MTNTNPAVANVDYSITAGSNAVVNQSSTPVEIVIPAGQSGGSITLTGLNNAAALGDDSLNVSIVSINGVTPSATQAQAQTLTLVDNNFPQISVENQAVIETGAGSSATALVTVRLSTAVTTPVTVNYSTADGTATANTDYVATTGTLTFLPGGPLFQTIPVQILGDTLIDGVESFLVNLTLPAGGRGTLVRVSGRPLQHCRQRSR